MAADLGRMSREELIAALAALQSEVATRAASGADARLAHDLEVHQVELEVQNRQLRETQVALEETSRRYLDLYDLAPVSYFTLDPAGRIEEANLTALKLFGIERAHLIGTLLVAYVEVADRARFRDQLRRCSRERIPIRTETALSPRRGVRVPCQIDGVPLLGGDGQLSGYRITLTDVSALKRGEERLALLSTVSEILGKPADGEVALGEALRLLVSGLADVALLDLLEESGELTRVGWAFANKATEAHLSGADGGPGLKLGATAPQRLVLATGRPIYIPDPSPSQLIVASGLEHEPLIEATSRSSLMLVPLNSRNATLGTLTLMSTDRLHPYSGADLRVSEDLGARLAAAIDNARLYRLARDAVKAREEMVTAVAHDLRNPVHAILLSVAGLLEGSPAAERGRSWKRLERIRLMAEQMSNLIDDLLDPGKPVDEADRVRGLTSARKRNYPSSR